MNKKELKEILEKHVLWLRDEKGGEKANLSYANLSSANLSYANLSCADLSYANLRSADLSSADLRSADLRSANLSYANLSCADLSSANLSYANLRSADLRSADLSSADLSSADLSSADLSSATIEYALKRKAVSNKFLMDRMFKFNKNYWIVYKSFGENYRVPKKWDIKTGSKIKQRIDENRWIDCSYGINVATLDWCKENCNNKIYKLWIPKTAEVCVPIYTDGKVRVSEAIIKGEVK
jgi:hypothetical protein